MQAASTQKAGTTILLPIQPCGNLRFIELSYGWCNHNSSESSSPERIYDTVKSKLIKSYKYDMIIMHF